MTNRERIMAVLHYQKYDRMPVISFGYWKETLDRWAEQGYVTREEAEDYRVNGDNGEGDRSVMRKLGFDFNWSSVISADTLLQPPFEEKILEQKPDGARVIRNRDGLICMVKPGVVSIPAEIGTSLKERSVWEKEYLPRFQMSNERIPWRSLEILKNDTARELPVGLQVGSLAGNMRNLLGVEQWSYLYYDDEELYREIADTMCGICFQCAKRVLESGAHFDYVHFWEDICFKNGPLVSPAVFQEVYAPWYKKITELVHGYGIDIVSVDCDGCIDKLVPIWLENGVNTMFPIEVGTWNASIGPWREKYGRELRGVGGMNKTVFAKGKEAVREEVERLKTLIPLGGYLPCPDHRIPPDAEFENVRYYCELMRNL